MILTFKLNKTPEEIFLHLTDMQKFAEAHPIISKIEKIENENYKVHETLTFGLLPFSFTYPVTVSKNEATKTVNYDAVVLKLIKIKMTFKLMAKATGTEVQENLDINSLLPVKALMHRVFRKQHTQLFKNIDSL